MPGLYSHTTRASGTVLTANIYNTDHQNHIDNHIPTQMDDYSASVAEMQSTADPGEVGTESQATSLAGELERLRFIITEITGGAQWYTSPTGSLASPRLPIGYISGIVPSLATADPLHDIQFTSGSMRYGDNTGDWALPTTLIKQFDNTFATGSNAGGLATGLTLASGTIYHFFGIEAVTGGTVDIIGDTSIGCTNCPTGWTKRRRIWSQRTYEDAAFINQLTKEEQTGGIRSEFEEYRLVNLSTGPLNFTNLDSLLPRGLSIRGVFGAAINSSVTSGTAPISFVIKSSPGISSSASQSRNWDVVSTVNNHMTNIHKEIYPNPTGGIFVDSTNGISWNNRINAKGFVDERLPTV